VHQLQPGIDAVAQCPKVDNPKTVFNGAADLSGLGLAGSGATALAWPNGRTADGVHPTEVDAAVRRF
jgi:hypothetical protein